jgi:hypothetical protein
MRSFVTYRWIFRQDRKGNVTLSGVPLTVYITSWTAISWDWCVKRNNALLNTDDGQEIAKKK